MGWQKTRYCYCGNCRFHKESEEGWASCPDESNPDRGTGNWLWIKVDSEDYENNDRAYIKAQVKSQVIEDVSGE